MNINKQEIQDQAAKLFSLVADVNGSIAILINLPIDSVDDKNCIISAGGDIGELSELCAELMQEMIKPEYLTKNNS